MSRQVRTSTSRLYIVSIEPEQAAEILSVGRSAAYEMVASDTFMTPLTPAGRTLRKILTIPLLDDAGVSYKLVSE